MNIFRILKLKRAEDVLWSQHREELMSKIDESIKGSIKKNGFPEKKVNLPFKPVFDACKKNGEKLSEVLERLKGDGILSQIGNEKILFFSPESEKKEKKSSINPNAYQSAMDQLKDMDPKKVEEIKEKVMSMSAEEREALMKYAQDFMEKQK